MFVFDTETRTDRTQCLTFGSYRFTVSGQLVKENLFYGDNLPTRDRQILERYASAQRRAQGEDNGISLLTRHEFAEKLFRASYKGRCLLVAFNFPFDISQVACDFTNARRRFAGGFSLDLWSYLQYGSEHKDRFRPSICIKHIDSKRALKGFTRRKKPDDEDLIPRVQLQEKKKMGTFFADGDARGL